MNGRRRKGAGGRTDYVRSDRVNELLREIIADELVRIDDDDLQFVTISGVSVDNELSKAVVYLSTLDLDADADLSAIERYRGRFRKAINTQAHLRKTPHLEFAIDPGLVRGERVEEILRDLGGDDDANEEE